MRNKLIRIFILDLISFSLSFSAFSQKQIDSPLGRFNLGILQPAGSFRNIAMGGVGTAFRDNNSINFVNPASYSSLDTNSFIFDIGMEYGINVISDGTSKHNSDDMNFDHLMIGFPVAKGIGVAAGIVPFSNGYYKISETVNDPSDPVTGEYTSYHIGGGNYSNVFLGTGINLTKNFSAGINMSVLFGSVSRANEVFFSEFTTEYHDDQVEVLQLNGINLDYGLQYRASLKKDFFLTAGFSLSSGKHCKSKYSDLTCRFTASTPADTLKYISDDSTKAFVPGNYRLGISFGQKNKFTAGVDYMFSNWSDAKFYGSAEIVCKYRALLFGLEYIPEKYSNYNLLKRIEYRFGGHVEDNYFIYNGQRIKEWGASLGFGIPLRGSSSKTKIYC